LNKKIHSHGKIKKFGRFSVQDTVKISSPMVDIFCLKQSLSEELSSISNKNKNYFSKNLQISTKKDNKPNKVFEIKLENTESITNRPKNFTFSQKPKLIQNSLNQPKEQKSKKETIKLNPLPQHSKKLFETNSNHQLFMKRQKSKNNVNIYSKVTPESTKRHHMNNVYSDTKEVKSSKLHHLNSFPVNSVEHSQKKYNFFKTNSNIIKNSKIEENINNINQLEIKKKKEETNSIHKLKKIISTDTEMYSIKSESKQSLNPQKAFYSKQVTLKDSELSLQKTKYLNKTKSYTKFVDFFKDSSRNIEEQPKHYVKRKTSIKTKNSENNSIQTINSSLQNNDFPFKTISSSKPIGSDFYFFNF